MVTYFVVKRNVIVFAGASYAFACKALKDNPGAILCYQQNGGVPATAKRARNFKADYAYAF